LERPGAGTEDKASMQGETLLARPFGGIRPIRCRSKGAETMPTITSEQREALYEQAVTHLSGIGDVWLAIERADFRRADRLGREFVDDLCLIIDGLGWPDAEPPASGVFELALPSEDLRRVVSRLREEAQQIYAKTLPRSPDEKEVIDQSRLAVEACGRILAGIAAEEGSK
jgi:hypothetical protein